ncbi:MAG TPA: DUF309 domain-containing protein [Chthoniobacterales bacterium]
MNKGERISQFVSGLQSEQARADHADIAHNPFYRGYFTCWNQQRYYEAHDVLEHLWLETDSEDADYFKGLIQAAGGFVHLQKHFEFPTHRVHGRRLGPAVRLFRLAEKNLAPYAPRRHAFDIDYLLGIIAQQVDAIVESHFTRNPWSPDSAPKLSLGD